MAHTRPDSTPTGLDFSHLAPRVARGALATLGFGAATPLVLEGAARRVSSQSDVMKVAVGFSPRWGMGRRFVAERRLKLNLAQVPIQALLRDAARLATRSED